MHSIRSDGTQEPAELAARVATRGLHAAALTDHDTTIGNAEFGAELAVHGIEFIPGCEISCLHTDADGTERSAHVLGYFIDDGDTPFQAMLAGLMDDRSTRNAKLLDRLHELGYDQLTQARIEEIAEKDLERANRPSFAAALLEAYPSGGEPAAVAEGLPASFVDVQDVFTRLLANDGPAYVKKAVISPAEAAATAKASGAVTVIAHPIITFCGTKEGEAPLSLAEKRARLDPILGGLADDGLVGVEAYYSRHSREEVAMLLDLCAAHDLVATGGSDYHGTNKPDLEVGIGVKAARGTAAQLQVPDSVLDQLAARRPGSSS
jgi:predicted metal-dependent phosphoesterase TrpH